MLKSIVTVIFILLLSSCDIPTSTPTDPNQSFSLARLESTTLGTVFSAQLTGHDSKGVNYTGTFLLANREQTVLNGVSVTPQEFIINISGGVTSMTFAGTRYIDKSGTLVSVVNQTTGLTCEPVSRYAMPATVKIGDFGILPAMTCSDNTTQERNWRVEDAKDGNVNIISNVTVKNQSNTLVSIADVTYTINGSGDILSCKIAANQPAINYTITLQIHENGLIPKATKTEPASPS